MPTDYPPHSIDSANFALISTNFQKNPKVLLADATDTSQQKAALTSAAR